MPSLVEIYTARAEHAIASLARWIAAGFPVVTEAELESRRAECDECPNLRHTLGIAHCGLCGCSATLKPWLATESCPARKWAAPPPQPPRNPPA